MKTFYITFRTGHPLEGCFCAIEALNQHEVARIALRNFAHHWQNIHGVMPDDLREVNLKGEYINANH